MNISIFGLGYVGTVTAGCLAQRGHSIVGVDVQSQKTEAMNRGVPPILEPGIDIMLRDAQAAGRLRATANTEEAICATDLSIVCVGTPSTVTGALDLQYVRQVIREMVGSLRRHEKSHVIVLRSTMLPGSTEQFAAEFLQDPNLRGRVALYYYPEFLREGTAIHDFKNPSLAVVGTQDGSSPPAPLVEALFGSSAAVVNWATAELIKYASNAFHATKVSFANEIGRLAKPAGIDARIVMELLCRDTVLNLSPYYMRPGNPFGGSCLPKDVRALAQFGRVRGLQLPMLESLLPSNERHLQSLLAIIAESGHSEIVILGLAFKTDTDDLRESAMLEVTQTLLGRGYQLRIYDPGLNLTTLIGSNRRLIETKMPHLASFLHADLAPAVGQRGLIVAAQRCVSASDLAKVITPQHRILDVNGWPELQRLSAPYEGFCW
jgi:GDP-mannose 6-dehydrogenase